jgi:hypothetical protein
MAEVDARELEIIPEGKDALGEDPSCIVAQVGDDCGARRRSRVLHPLRGAV